MKVKIINPEFVVRVGYEFDHRYYLDQIYDDLELRERLDMAMMPFLDFGSPNAHAAMQDVYSAIARYRKLQGRKDGAERRIFTVREEHLVGMIFTVKSVRRVQTGIYNHGWYRGESEWEPPFLSNVKYHTIYTLRGYGRQIEAIHVEVIDAV